MCQAASQSSKASCTGRVDRSPNEHLAFGFGPHYCLGANLARMEVQVVLRRILTRLPRLRPGACRGR